MNFTKIEADLFAQDHKYALAHCIAEDARMVGYRYTIR